MNRDIFYNVKIPVFGAPLFIISNPKMVIAQCKGGIVGSFPALNAKCKNDDSTNLGKWIKQINEELDKYNQKHPDTPAAPFAVNLIVHKSNKRLEKDVEICHKNKVPIWITSLGAREFVNDAAHDCEGITLHDVINNKFAKKAIEKGADGLIAVAAGAGGHSGSISPFSLVQEIREWFKGFLVLSGSISTGKCVLAAQAMGADYAYIGSAFIASTEANAQHEYKKMLISCSSEDIIYTDFVSGIYGNYLKPSITSKGIDLNNLPNNNKNFILQNGTSKPKAWKDIWSAGHGIGSIKKIRGTKFIVKKLIDEYLFAKCEFKHKLEYNS